MTVKEYANDTILLVTHGQFARNLIAAYNQCSYHDVTPFVNAEIRILKVQFKQKQVVTSSSGHKQDNNMLPYEQSQDILCFSLR